MKILNKVTLAISTASLFFATSPLIAAEDTTITAAVAPAIVDAGDTAKAIAVLLMLATVVVLAAMWAWGMLKKGKSG